VPKKIISGSKAVRYHISAFHHVATFPHEPLSNSEEKFALSAANGSPLSPNARLSLLSSRARMFALPVYPTEVRKGAKILTTERS